MSHSVAPAFRPLLTIGLLISASSAGVAQVHKDRPCEMTLTYNQSVSFAYQVPGTAPPVVISFPFFFGVSQVFSGWLQQLATGYYPFGNIISTGGAAILNNAKIPKNCYYTGVVYGTDTTWLAQSTLGTPDGDVALLYNGDDDQQYCNGTPVDDNSQCVDDGGGGDGGTYGPGGGGEVSGGGYLVCWWTDYYDDDWVYQYTVYHGCWVS